MGCSSSDEEESSFTELESKKTERKEKGMKRNINIILFNIIWLTALIQSCQSKIDSDFASVKSAIDSQNSAYVKAYNNKDAESVAALHTADATVMPPNQKISQGKKEIQNYPQHKKIHFIKQVAPKRTEDQFHGVGNENEN